ncbi:MAG: class I SAM-dependent methyltransferase [Chloroflexota bacterium]
MMGPEAPQFSAPAPSKDDIRHTYDRLSRFYDYWTVLTESQAADRALELAGITNGEDVLEAAVGTGRIFEHIVSLNSNGSNVGFDFSSEMLNAARKRLAGSIGNYELQVADAYSMPYENGTFDLVVSNYFFDLLPYEDFVTVLAEFKRVLRPGGRIVITSWTPARMWYSRIWDWLARTFPKAMAGCRPVVLEPAVRDAGFINIHQEYVSQMTFPSTVVRAEKPHASAS